MTTPALMQAMTSDRYGPPEVLQARQVARPPLTDNGVLVRVRASSVNAGDWHLLRGEPWLVRLIYGGLLTPKIPILGTDLAGQVEAVGQQVTLFQPGDDVVGELSACGFGAFAEYVCVPESALVAKPVHISYEQAAAVPAAGMAALQGLRDLGQLQPGQRLLVGGASGGVGSLAVQIGKALGAEVTALARPEKMEMLRGLGADDVVDVNRLEVLIDSGQHYDVILDAAAFRPVADYRPLLSPGGAYILVGGSIARLFQVMLFGQWMSWRQQRRIRCLSSTPTQADLTTLCDWLEAGILTPFIDRTFPLSQLSEAIRYVERRQVRGKVVVLI
ncbi:NAD(P)-dependent alcohol dehydrogenase [Synechococcus elongatus]|uniref:Zinc-binding oxidoreductase n=3 Tax=Synechococcus elongatus TaxID=32046 RepID=Q31JT6_SYNE7|nr:NAD(P)-dependent alcohol dehydrogenase [Synechococcus elongatus]ABB58671.1 putative zinc-binding oxidoreductase [Synechococcus elongatus PCC 7942 = FACHB-805]UOW72483.1 NAD(P)-dependent alcohol dehydrogenase [Synechococcus elongatus PCC 7943]UOW75204.1 NAD(P)-dependent alcohol dehydrogenase [Synechococcus elongatus PCC 6311]UOW77923.1 NAD(P)-dependent alcohol dehydrogenase [Synechococcus elongatus PCC 6301]